MFEVDVKITGHQQLFVIKGHLADPEPLMRGIALELLSFSDKAFDREGYPTHWKALSARTLASRRKKGTDGKILQASPAGLRHSVHPFHSAHEAGIGAGSGKSAKYAAIHQLGGEAGRGHRSIIPARPYLPMTGSGDSLHLIPEVEKSVLEMAYEFLEKP